MNTGNVVGTLIITFLILIVLFLVLREFFCWYWKVNQRLAVLSEIRDLLAASKSGIASSTGSASAEIAVAGATSEAKAAPVAAFTRTRDDATIQRLAERVRGNPRLPIDEKIELLQHLGGKFAWDKGSSCRVSYQGQDLTFSGGKEFGEWLASVVVPSVLRHADS